MVNLTNSVVAAAAAAALPMHYSVHMQFVTVVFLGVCNSLNFSTTCKFSSVYIKMLFPVHDSQVPL